MHGKHFGSEPPVLWEDTDYDFDKTSNAKDERWVRPATLNKGAQVL